VAFLKKLPGMSEEDYAKLVTASMGHSDPHHHVGGDEGQPRETAPASHEHD